MEEDERKVQITCIFRWNTKICNIDRWNAFTQCLPLELVEFYSTRPHSWKSNCFPIDTTHLYSDVAIATGVQFDDFMYSPQTHFSL